MEARTDAYATAPPDVELHTADVKMNLRLKTIPWARIIVDTLLVAALVLASSSFLSVR